MQLTEASLKVFVYLMCNIPITVTRICHINLYALFFYITDHAEIIKFLVLSFDLNCLFRFCHVTATAILKNEIVL